MKSNAAKFVVGPNGRPEAVLLRMADYRRLISRLEDHEDSKVLDRAERSSKKLLQYSEVRKRLKSAGKL